MPKLTGPLFSLDARQTLGKTIVYSAWKDINYARLRVIPYNPKKPYQTGVRNTMRWGILYFTKGSYVTASQKIYWNNYAAGTSMSGINRFMKFFVTDSYDNATGTFMFKGVNAPQ